VNLFAICGTAFASVFILLITMALTIWAITALFPVKEEEEADDAALVAAISTAVATLYPGARVTRIEEV
jgi:fatty acid desaturase